MRVDGDGTMALCIRQPCPLAHKCHTLATVIAISWDVDLLAALKYARTHPQTFTDSARDYVCVCGNVWRHSLGTTDNHKLPFHVSLNLQYSNLFYYCYCYDY